MFGHESRLIRRPCFDTHHKYLSEHLEGLEESRQCFLLKHATYLRDRHQFLLQFELEGLTSEYRLNAIRFPAVLGHSATRPFWP